jgi:hypothetical protein
VRFGAFVCEFFQAGLHVGRSMEINQMPGDFGREAVSQRRQELVKDRGWLCSKWCIHVFILPQKTSTQWSATAAL